MYLKIEKCRVTRQHVIWCVILIDNGRRVRSPQLYTLIYCKLGN